MSRGPKLRFVDAFPVDTEDGEMIALRDPKGVSEEIVLITKAGLFILQLCDGSRTQDEIVAACKNQYGIAVPPELLAQLLDYLDANYFLDNARTAARVREIEQSLLSQKTRPMAHAGLSYPADRTELMATLDRYFTGQKGAGLPGAINGLPTPPGVVAPHIDPRIGGATYSHAYRRIAESPPADVYVVLGTGHAGLREMYSVLPLDFETPLGLVETDKEFIAELRKRYSGNILRDVLLHKSEHTIEFQTVFLKKIFAERPFKIVPILCSFSYHVFNYPGFEREQMIIRNFIKALRETIRSEPGKVTVIASVDLAHVGPRYGDETAPDSSFLESVEQHDRQALENALRGDAEGWARSIASIKDKYRICGFSPIYTMLASIDAANGELLHYEKGVMDDRESVVSYCSAVLYP